MGAEGTDPERLAVGVKVAYGAPVFASAALSIPIAIHMTKFYADQVLVPLGALGVAIALPCIVFADALAGLFRLDAETHALTATFIRWVSASAMDL